MGTTADIDFARVERWARESGFDACGIAPVELPEHADTLHRWIEAGYAGSMAWLERNAEVRLDLRSRFPWAESAIVVLRGYRPPADATPRGLARFVASYAWGTDYHDVLPARLEALAERLREHAPAMRSQVYVDTGPVLERQLAAAAGLGWTAHNTLLLHPDHGSRFFLGVLITDLELSPTPGRVGSCGSCRACQPACPTGAFVQPGVLDARRCISYLTIEHRGPIARELRPAMGQWLFGCDLCQTCCPFETRATRRGDAPFALAGAVAATELAELLGLDDEAFRARFRSSPLWRPKREGLLRNALIVAVNGEHQACAEPARRLLDDASPVLREAASWCVARLGTPADAPRLARALERETEEWVAEAMRDDLRRLGGTGHA